MARRGMAGKYREGIRLPSSLSPAWTAVPSTRPALRRPPKPPSEPARGAAAAAATRSPLANIVSWARERSSARGDLQAAFRQYWAAYRLLFGICAKGTFPFHLLSLEALALEVPDYVASLFALLGLPPTPESLDIPRRTDVNLRRYRDPWIALAPPATDAA
jgi:hypothetical protein